MASVSSPVGTVRISLPFTVADLTEASGFGTGSIVYANITALGSGGALGIRLDENVAYAQLYELTTTSQAAMADKIVATSYFWFTVTYFTT